MEEKIIKIAENLIEIRKLEEELNDKEYWIQKAQEEAGFVPAEGDWIHIEITLYKIKVSVHHKQSEGSKGDKYWINGVWFDNSFDSNYPLHEKMLAKMRAW
jgi:hypothetical protein